MRDLHATSTLDVQGKHKKDIEANEDHPEAQEYAFYSFCHKLPRFLDTHNSSSRFLQQALLQLHKQGAEI
jgi:predicted glycoside hydrolase/deacetylase ChbG (UPF0249 family)